MGHIVFICIYDMYSCPYFYLQNVKLLPQNLNEYFKNQNILDSILVVYLLGYFLQAIIFQIKRTISSIDIIQVNNNHIIQNQSILKLYLLFMISFIQQNSFFTKLCYHYNISNFIKMSQQNSTIHIPKPRKLQNIQINPQSSIKNSTGNNLASFSQDHISQITNNEHLHQRSNYFIPMFIVPSVIISNENSSYFHCSSCGHTVIKKRNHECVQTKIKYKHYLQKGSRTTMKKLVKVLYHENGVALSTYEQQTVLSNYYQWLLQGRQQNIRLGMQYRSYRNRQKTKQIKISTQEQSLQKALKTAKRLDDINQMLVSKQRIMKQTLKDIEHDERQIQRTTMGQIRKNQLIRNQVDKIYQSVRAIVQSTIKSQIANIIDDRPILTLQQQAIIIQNASNKIKEFVLPKMVMQWKNKIQKYIIQNQLDTSTKRHDKKKKIAANFLMKLHPIALGNRQLLSLSFAEQPQYIKQQAYYILKQLKKQYDLKVADISYFINKKKKITKKRFTNLQTIKNNVQQLFGQRQYQLGVDLWFSFCLGLRLSDLKKVNIRSRSGKYFDMINLQEDKNHHQTNRCIPSSLKIIVQWLKLSFPITIPRLKRLIAFSRVKLGGFYILRHALITQTLSGLMKNSKFTPHSTNDTTLRYYVDYNNYHLIDSIFDLNIKNSSFDHLKIPSNLRGDIDKFGIIHEAEFSIPYTTEIILPQNFDIKQQMMQDNTNIELINHQNQNIQKFSEVSNSMTTLYSLAKSFLQSIQHLQFMSIIYTTYCSIFKLLSSYLNQDIVVLYCGIKVVFKPSVEYLQRCQSLVKRATQQIYQYQQLELPNSKRVQIQYRNKQQLKNQQEQEQDESKSKHKNMTLPIIYPQQQLQTKDYQTLKSKTHMLWQSQQFQEPLDSVDHLIFVGQSTQKNKVFFSKLSKKEGKIHNSKQSIKVSERIKQIQKVKTLNREGVCTTCDQVLQLIVCQQQTCNLHQFNVYCKCVKKNSGCSCQISKTPKGQFYCNDIFLCAVGVKKLDNIIQRTYKSPKFSIKKNNIAQKIYSTGRKYIKWMHASLSLTQRLFIPWNEVSFRNKEIIQQVMTKQQYLPITIEETFDTITGKSKGNGVFARSDIPKNTIIATYLGIIKPYQQVSPQDDSCLSIGWCKREQYYITCIQACNVGRFMNDNQLQSNCTICHSVLERDKFVPFFVTFKDIKSGEELTWDYGESYMRSWL